MASGLKCLKDSGSASSTIKRKHTKRYERRMQSNKVEYSTYRRLYCMVHGVKVPFFIPKLSKRKIIEYHFHVNNSKVNREYDMK